MKLIQYVMISFLILIMIGIYQPVQAINKPILIPLPLLGKGLIEGDFAGNSLADKYHFSPWSEKQANEMEKI